MFDRWTCVAIRAADESQNTCCKAGVCFYVVWGFAGWPLSRSNMFLCERVRMQFLGWHLPVSHEMTRLDRGLLVIADLGDPEGTVTTASGYW